MGNPGPGCVHSKAYIVNDETVIYTPRPLMRTISRFLLFTAEYVSHNHLLFLNNVDDLKLNRTPDQLR
jgi:hypothetical protein